MGEAIVTPEERYITLVEAFLQYPGVVQEGKGFGSSALKIGGKIFAMLVRGRLVVKLPRQRVDALIASGHGERFDPGHGRIMKEWLTIDQTAESKWQALATEAMEFVGSQR